MTDARSAADGETVPSHEIELRLFWQQTWRERDAHYSATVPTLTVPVGCIYLIETCEDQGSWAWSMTADDYEISRNCGAAHGIERSARHAAKQVEDAWFSAIRGTRHDAPMKVNGYAAAKHRQVAAA